MLEANKVRQDCDALFRIKIPQAAWEEAEEKSPQVTFPVHSTNKSDKTLGKLTLLARLPVNKKTFLLPLEEKYTKTLVL